MILSRKTTIHAGMLLLALAFSGCPSDTPSYIVGEWRSTDAIVPVTLTFDAAGFHSLNFDLSENIDRATYELYQKEVVPGDLQLVLERRWYFVGGAEASKPKLSYAVVELSENSLRLGTLIDDTKLPHDLTTADAVTTFSRVQPRN